MKKLIALVLAVFMLLGLAACDTAGGNETTNGNKTVKVGLICIGDENDQGYTYNFIRGKEAATETLAAKGIKVYKTMVGNYMTSLEMNGFSISLLRLDDELKALLDEPADTPALKV